jgi:HAD superfamily hydrolase (TIGR01509 family)
MRSATGAGPSCGLPGQATHTGQINTGKYLRILTGADNRRRLTEYCNEVFEHAMPVKPGAATLVAYLAREGVPVAVATSANRRTAERHLDGSGLRAQLPLVFTRDDVDHPKPDPAVFLKAAAGLGMAPENCLAVEDSFTGIMAAHAAGTMVVMVPDIVPPTPEIAALCCRVTGDLHEVQAIIAAQWRG